MVLECLTEENLPRRRHTAAAPRPRGQDEGYGTGMHGKKEGHTGRGGWLIKENS